MQQQQTSGFISYRKLFYAKCRAWNCRTIIVWDDRAGVYPDGLGVTKDGQVLYINRKCVRKITLAQSLRIFRKRDSQEQGSSDFGSEGTHQWMRLLEKGLGV